MTDRMKRKALPTLLAAAGLVFGLGTASAQPRPPKKLEWGLSFGFNSASMDLIAKQAIFEFTGGLSAEVQLGNRLALCSGLAYTRKGGDGSLSSWGMMTVITPVRVRVQYLELPLLVKFIPTPNLYLEGGVYGAVKVGGDISVRGVRDADDLINGTDAGYVLGLGGEFNFLGRKQYTGLRYSHGLSRVLANGNNHLITITYLFGVYF